MELDAFRHEAFLYADEHEFVQGAATFLEEGLDAGEPALVALPGDKIRPLRERLGDRAGDVAFADMAVIGRNPGRILHAWYDFADAHVGEGRRARGIGEPVFPKRTDAELVECQRHERLLNLAFDGGPPWTLMCPYDTGALPCGAVDEARFSHPLLHIDGEVYGNSRYRPLDPADRFARPLSPAPARAVERPFDRASLGETRSRIHRNALGAGLGHDRARDLVAAVSELAANSLRHGGGRGVLRSWHEGGDVVHEVADGGVISDPLVGRRLPPPEAVGGRGLWLVNQLCDLVELRSDERGTVVRVHMHAA